jgi:hypothetical protein
MYLDRGEGRLLFARNFAAERHPRWRLLHLLAAEAFIAVDRSGPPDQHSIAALRRRRPLGRIKISRSRPPHLAPASTSLVLPLPRYAAPLCGQPRVRDPLLLCSPTRQKAGALKIELQTHVAAGSTQPRAWVSGRLSAPGPFSLATKPLSPVSLGKHRPATRPPCACARTSLLCSALGGLLPRKQHHFLCDCLAPAKSGERDTAPGRERGRQRG